MLEKFRELLEALDAASGGDEDLEDLNAEYEDALMMLEALDPKAEDYPQELADALEEFDALRLDYKKYPQTQDIARRLGLLVVEAEEALMRCE